MSKRTALRAKVRRDLGRETAEVLEGVVAEGFERLAKARGDRPRTAYLLAVQGEVQRLAQDKRARQAAADHMKSRLPVVELTLPISGQKVPAWIVREAPKRVTFMLEDGLQIHLRADVAVFARIRG